ncbi:MAG: Uma2 family endonuclease [Chitinophagaceae bacterium]|nr:Uma2 family endonuclease [Chitinophagaceae bacterium]
MFTVYDTDKDVYTQVEEPDPSLNYTYADYLKWNFEERLELFRGKIFRLSASNTRHQATAGHLFLAIGNFLKRQKCKPFIAPFDVRLPVRNSKKDNEVTTVVQPDICVVCDESKIDSRGCCGAPDLVIEILSPGNTKKEVKLKYGLYEEAGVKEYWMVYPEEENVVVFTLNDTSKYDPAIFYAGDDIVYSKIIPGLAVSLADIFTK